MTTTSKMVKITALIDGNTWHGKTAERFWATPIGGSQYELENSPLYVRGISYKDVVEGEYRDGELVAVGVARRGGHSNYQILLNQDSKRSDFERLWARLAALGCTYESSKDPENVFAVDVPPQSDVYAVYAVLEDGEREGVWSFGEGFCGHPLQN